MYQFIPVEATLSCVGLPAGGFVQRAGPPRLRRFSRRGDSLCVVPGFWPDAATGRERLSGLLTSPPACRMSQECDVLHMHSCPDVSKNFPACPFSPGPESLYLSRLFIFAASPLPASSATVSLPLRRPVSAFGK